MKIKTNFQNYTKLPLREVTKLDEATGIALHVVMPNRVTIINYKQISKSFLGASRTIDTLPGDIIGRLRELEEEAKEYLLDKWLKK